MSLWVFVVVAFLVGVAAGWLTSWSLRRRDPSEQRLQRMQTVLDRFQGDVAQHFQESGELITRLRSDVEALYHHLERGAGKLTAEDAVQSRLRELDWPRQTHGGQGPNGRTHLAHRNHNEGNGDDQH